MFLDFLNLSVFQIGFAVIIIFIAHILKGLSGFGSGLIAIPLLALFLPITFIVPVLGLLSYSGTVLQSFSLRKQVVWKVILPLIPFTMIGIAAAVWVLSTVDAYVLVFCLGLFVFLYAIYSLLPIQDIQTSRYWIVVVSGGFGGLVSALFGTGGPFYVIYLKTRGLNKSQFRATIASIFLIDGGARIVGYASSGLYTPQVLSLVAMLFPVLFIGMYVGHHLHIKIDQKQFNLVISVTLLLSGTLLMYKAIMN
jgi:uncharacterized membrane protein YfcA